MEPNMIVGMIRHGETNANRDEIVQGRLDIHGLTKRGRQQIERLAQYIGELGIPFRWIYSSPSRRARETAEILSYVLGLQVEYDTSLLEMDFGKLEGLPYSEVYKRKDFRTMAERFSQYRAPGGERSVDVQQRMVNFLEQLRVNTLIVSHAIAIATVLCWIKDLSLDHVWEQNVGNGHLYLLEKKGGRFTIIKGYDALIG
ncbi:MAG: histidine phosphatase family protein [Thermotogae bacterium]|nr:MAG: histidine phosphatase family protein [Thermotogota bacterium]